MPNDTVLLDNSSESESQVHRVTVRPPPFYPEEPELWFASLECQFQLAGITQDATKYAYVLAQLEPQYAKEVKDIIRQPPALDKFGAIKAV